MSIAERSILNNDRVISPGGGKKKLGLTIGKKRKQLSENNKHNRKRHRMILEDSSNDDLVLSNRDRLANRKPEKRTLLSENDHSNNSVSIRVNKAKVLQVKTPSDENARNFRDDIPQPKKLPKITEEERDFLQSEGSEEEQLTLLKNQTRLPETLNIESPSCSQVGDNLTAQREVQADEKHISRRMRADSNNEERDLTPKAIMPELEKESSDDEALHNPSKKRAVKAKPKKKAKRKIAPSKSSKSKKVYDMPGQKKDTPNELNGARIFYESLRQQNPKSQMAEEYLLKFGLLPYEEAAAIVKAQQKLKTKAKIGATKKSNVENNLEKTIGAKTKKKANKQPKVQMESGKSNSSGKKVKGRKKNKKKIIKAKQLACESSSDESNIKKAKQRKSTKKSKRKKKPKTARRKSKEERFDDFLDGL